MMKFLKCTLLGLLTVLQFACSGQKGSPRNLEVSFAAIASNSFAGGAIVRIKNTTTGVSNDVVLNAPPYVVTVDDGKWNFYFIGFVGPGPYEGDIQCGGVVSDLGPSTPEVRISVTQSACSQVPYPEMISIALQSSTGAKWDFGTWDQSRWGN